MEETRATGVRESPGSFILKGKLLSNHEALRAAITAGSSKLAEWGAALEFGRTGGRMDGRWGGREWGKKAGFEYYIFVFYHIKMDVSVTCEI